MTGKPQSDLERRAEEFTKLHLQKRVASIVRSYAKRRARAEKAAYLSQRPLAWEEFHRTGPPTPEEMHRALRGVVTHVLPRVRSHKLIHLGRRAAPYIKDGNKGTCNWCQETCYWPNRWHRWCRLHYWMTGDGPSGVHLSKGLKKILNWKNILPVTPCAWCRTSQGTMTIDHKVALALVARTGDHRAFLPGNLQWLCRDCHHEKTDQDNKLLKETKLEQGAPLLPPRWGPNAPIQFRGEREKRRHAYGNRIIMPE